MNRKELKERIASMPLSRIMGMRPENLAILTDKYCEELVIDIVVKDDSNNGQRRILEQIKTSYASWMKSSSPMWGLMGVGQFPEYLRKMAFELDCGNVITKTTNAKSKGAEASVKSKNTSAETTQLKARIQELEAENKALKEELEGLRADAVPEKEIHWHDKVRLDLLLRLIKKDGANLEMYRNKTKAASVMSAITGLPLQTCKNYCSDPILNTETHRDEILELNTKLQALGMEIRL